jgi:hypothetical protein
VKPALRLNDTEKASNAWQKVEEQIKTRLDMHRKVVENPLQPERDRLIAASAITELKDLLKLAQPAKEKPDTAGE